MIYDQTRSSGAREFMNNISDKSKFLSTLRDFLLKTEDSEKPNFISLKLNGTTTLVQTKFQVMLEEHRNSTGIDRLVKDVVVENAFKSERMAPGSFDLFFKLVRDEFLNRKLSDLNRFFEALTQCHGAVTSRRPTLKDFRSFIDTEVSEPFMKSLISRTLEIAGFSGKITVERSSSSDASIETVQGYTFQGDNQFSIVRPLQVNDVSVVIIDGYVETVAEIHHLLTQIHDMKKSVLLIVRGMSDDVKHTLKVNMDSGRINVYSYVIQLDVDTVNVLNDMAAVSNNDVYSSIKGSLISSIRLADCGSVSKCFLSNDKFTLIEKSSRDSVKTHVSSLFEKLKQINDEVNEQVLMKRIKALTTNNVVLRLPDDQHFVQRSQVVDNVLRSYSSMLDHGVTDIDGKTYLTGSLVAASVYYRNFCSFINELGVVIT